MNSRLSFKEGNIGGALGFSSGAGGSGFAGPQQAPDQTGMANLQNSYQQLQDVAAGKGPNPAMAQYTQNVQDLAKQQAGAISSVQGISPALAARMASQQSSGAMQNAAAAGANVQAQQQLGAMGQASQVAAQQAGAANQMQLGINNNNTTLASGQMNRGLVGGVVGSVGSVLAHGGEVGYAGGGGVSSSPFSYGAPQSKFGQFLQGATSYDNTAGASKQPGGGFDNGPDKKGTQDFFSKVFKSFKSKGAQENAGQGPTMDNTAGLSDGAIPYNSAPDYAAGLSSGAGDAAAGGAADAAGAATGAEAAGAEAGGGDAMAALLAKGGKVQAVVSPGEVYIPPGKLKQAIQSRNPLAAGSKVPGRPKVKGDSYANDVVPAKLEAGGVVIPNSIMQSKNPAKGAHDMIAGIIAKRKARK